MPSWFFSHSAPRRISSIRLIVRRSKEERREEHGGSTKDKERKAEGGGGKEEERVVEEGRERKRTDGRTSELRRLPRRNIKLNKRSIFCSLFLTGVELRHFATLFSLRPLAGLPSSLLPPSRAAPARACTLFLPLADFLLHHPLFLLLLLLLLLFVLRLFLCFAPRVSLFLSPACASKRAAQRRGTLSK